MIYIYIRIYNHALPGKPHNVFMLCAYFWLLPFCFFDSRHRRGCAKLGLCKEILPCIHTLKNIHVWYSTYVGPQILIETTRSTHVVWVLEVTCIYLHHFMWLPGAPKDGYLHTYIDLHHFMNLRDFLNFRSWQHQKRSNSARLPSKMDSWMQSWQPRTNAFCDFWTSKSGLNMLCFFNILTWKCASRHNSVHFLDITS